MSRLIHELQLLYKKNDNDWRGVRRDLNVTGSVMETILAYISYSAGGNVLKAFQQLFDPKRNEFNLVKVGSALSSITRTQEIWTDSPSILLRKSAIPKLKSLAAMAY